MPGSPPYSPNLNIPRYDDDDEAEFSVQVNGITDVVDALFPSGALASIPAAGTRGRKFYATDTDQVYFDTGTAGVAGSTAGWVLMSAPQAGCAIIPGDESVSSGGAWQLMPTPDEVAGLNISSAYGILRVWYQAQFQAATGEGEENWAAIFVNSNQAVVQGYVSSSGTIHGPITQAANLSEASYWNPLYSFFGGLLCSESASSYNADATTGQIFGFNSNDNSNAYEQIGGVSGSGGTELTLSYAINGGGNPTVFGGPCDIFVPQGDNYSVSIKFYSQGPSGSISTQGRKLFVQAISFTA